MYMYKMDVLYKCECIYANVYKTLIHMLTDH